MEDYKHAEIVGPFTEPEYSYAVVDGCKVPYIKLVKRTGAEDGKTEIFLDSKVYIVDDSGIDVWLHLLANAMAVAAGYNRHGEGGVKYNPFAVRMTSIAPP